MTTEIPGFADEVDPSEIMNRAGFAAALTALRERAGLTVRDVAKLTGVPHTTLGDYFSGKTLPTLKSADVLSRVLEACAVTDESSRRAWAAALIRVRRAPSQRTSPVVTPYRGLASFEAQDAEWFFGREELIRSLFERVQQREPHPVVVIGSSGSGKSSLLRAGLLPLLADDQVVLTSPRTQPNQSLTDTLREFDNLDSERAVLVIDQFEELFTAQITESARASYVEALVRFAARQPVVLGLRADFYDRASELAALGPALQQVVLVTPMTEDQLRAVITEPARRANIAIEPGLTELLIRDLFPHGYRAGQLPLLSHALLATWRNDATRLTVAAYNATGGVQRAVAQSADVVYESLDEAEQQLVRRLFVRLVHTSEHAPDTRRHALRGELADGRNDARLAKLLDRFIDQRLLTADKDGIVITHEALIWAWPLLRGWLDTDRAGLRVHRQLSGAARVWDDGHRDPAALYRGGLLETALDWAEEHDEDLNALEREFLVASQHGRTTERRARRRQILRLRSLVAALMVVLAVTGTLAFTVQVQRSSAEHDRDLATSRQVAAQARLLRASDRSLEAQLAVAAYRIAPTPEARASLLDVSSEPTVTRMPGADEVVQGAAVSPSGGLLASAGTDKHVRLWNIADRTHPHQVATPLGGSTDTLFATAFSPDGKVLAAAGGDKLIRLWDVTDPEHPAPLGSPVTGPAGTVYSLAFSPDGNVLAAGSADNTVRLWYLNRTGQPTSLGAPLTGAAGYVQSLAFTGHLLAAGSADHTVRLWDITDPVHPIQVGGPLGGPHGTVFTVTFSPDGRTLAAGSSDRTVYLWRLDDPAHPAMETPPLTASTGWVNSVSFSPDGTTLAVGASDNQLRLWDLAAHRVIQTLPHPAPVTVTTFLDGGRTVFTAAADGTIRLWALPGRAITDPSGPVFSLAYPATRALLAVSSGRADDSIELWDTTNADHPVQVGGPITSPSGSAPFSGAVLFNADGRLLITGCRDGSVQLWNTDDPIMPRLITAMPGDGALVESFALSPDGHTLAVAGDDHDVRLWNITTPAMPVSLPTLRGPSNYVYSVAFSPDGTTLAAGSADTKVWLWTITDPAHVVSLPSLDAFHGYVYGVAFSPRDHLLVAGSADKTVRLWTMADPAHPALVGSPITGPSNYVYGIAISPDGRMLAIASTDASVRLVDITHPEAPAEQASLTGATDAVYTVTFTPDGRGIAAGTAERRVRLWVVDPDQMITSICSTAGTGLTETEWKRYVPDLPFRQICP